MPTGGKHTPPTLGESKNTLIGYLMVASVMAQNPVGRYVSAENAKTLIQGGVLFGVPLLDAPTKGGWWRRGFDIIKKFHVENFDREEADFCHKNVLLDEDGVSGILGIYSAAAEDEIIRLMTNFGVSRKEVLEAVVGMYGLTETFLTRFMKGD